MATVITEMERQYRAVLKAWQANAGIPERRAFWDRQLKAAEEAVLEARNRNAAERGRAARARKKQHAA